MLLLTLVSGCAATPRTVPVTSVKPFRTITWSCQDTATTRRQVIAHNSVYASLKKGKKIVYGDHCPVKSEGSVS